MQQLNTIINKIKKYWFVILSGIYFLIFCFAILYEYNTNPLFESTFTCQINRLEITNNLTKLSEQIVYPGYESKPIASYNNLTGQKEYKECTKDINNILKDTDKLKWYMVIAIVIIFISDSIFIYKKDTLEQIEKIKKYFK